MATKSSDEFADQSRDWCNNFSELGADALVFAGLISKEDFERASAIISEELFARLCVNDYPPMPESLDGKK